MTDDSRRLDPDLRALFSEELSRRAPALAAARRNPRDAQRTLHALRGAAAMMGAHGLAGRLHGLETAIRDDPERGGATLLDEVRLALLSEGLDPSPLERTDPDTFERRALTPPAPLDAIDRGAGRSPAYGSSRPRAVSVAPSAAPSAATSVAPSAATSVAPSAATSVAPGPIATDEGDRPTNPSGLRARTSIAPEVRAFFFSETRGRLESFVAAVERARVEPGEPSRAEALRDAFRHAHAIKGSASTVGYPGIAGAAHAIESALAGSLAAGSDAKGSLDALSSAAAALSGSLAAPDGSDEIAAEVQQLLRAAGFAQENVSWSMTARAGRGTMGTADAVRVPAASLQALDERIADVAAAAERIAGAGARSADASRSLADAGDALEEAIVRLGPPRPWGVTADVLERLRGVARLIRDRTSAIEDDRAVIGREADALAAVNAQARERAQQLSVTEARWLFDRVAPAAEIAARASGREFRIAREGEDVPLPRAVAERLVEPLSQLVRNAIAHGIEPPPRRLGLRKAMRGTLTLRAMRQDDTLRVMVEDDGAGVDLDAVRARGREAGLLAGESTDEQALALLFVPGFSTRPRADVVAGRGIGLDLVRREAIDLGGTVRVRTTSGRGTRFTLDIPVRTGSRAVLVVWSGSIRVAVPIERVVRVRPAREDDRAPSLASRLGPSMDANDVPRVVLELRQGPHLVATSVTRVERAREVVVRPLPALCARAGPWTGGVIEADGAVLLVLDPTRVKFSETDESLPE